MSQTYQITSISGEELDVIIQNSVVRALQEWKLPEPKIAVPEYTTRKEVAKLLKVSLPTLDDYIKRGLITAVRIGGRVRIKREEVERSMIEVKSLKYKRS
ncbi:helix-turn-helix domain-containing protein [Dyadobacter alkalitolerans]|uniref:helix-turn-helix domain-containing protein n=1 Tax=Dyadobacter alkalitolerans TaxID=492736 RepID=UPI0005538372|nr:helix-turn-helix domain-containing protein [Dyadobacter alkalitolerans]